MSPASPSSHTTVKEKNHPIHWVLLILILISLCLSGFILYQSQQLTEQLNELSSSYGNPPSF